MERELSRILDAVEPARKQQRPAYVRVIERGTLKAIREALQTERYHVLHVTCHAGPGMLVLENEDGSKDSVNAQRFCDEVLPPGRGVPLVVLAGCATALNVSGSQGETALPGLARQLLARGVLAVLAMQAPVSDPYATDLGARLYRALATFERPAPLAALAEARRTLEIDREDGKLTALVDLAEWATPALYLRGPSLPLYDPEAPFEDIQPPPRAPLRQGSRRPPRRRVRGKAPGRAPHPPVPPPPRRRRSPPPRPGRSRQKQCRVPRSSAAVFSFFSVADRSGKRAVPDSAGGGGIRDVLWILTWGLGFSRCDYSVALRAQELAIHRLKPTRTFLKRSAGRLL